MNRVDLRYLAGIFFISSTTLSLQVVLTRFFSISQQYHFAFLVVSIAFLGYGASGSFLARFQKLLRFERYRFLTFSSLAFSLSILLGFLLSNLVPFDFFSLAWDTRQIFIIPLYYLILGLPFLFAGLTISYAITQASGFVNRVYFADLVGAGAGTLLILVIFLPQGDRSAVLIVSFLALTGAFFFGLKEPPLMKGLILILMFGEIALFLAAPGWLGFQISPYKALPTAMRYPGARHIMTKWNAQSRIDVIDSPAVRSAPGLSLMYDKPLPQQLGLTLDGGELNAITQMESLNAPSLEFLRALPSSLPFSLVDHPDILVVNPKGGLNILQSLFHKPARIDVIEKNPLLIKILSRELGPFTGYLFSHPKVRHLSTNTRYPLENRNYDIIMLSLTDVFGSSQTGLYGFGENYLFTRESFQNFLDGLAPEGIISMTVYLLPPPRGEIRIFSTWVSVLEGNKKDPKTHLIALRSWATFNILVKQSPFTDEEIKILKKRARELLLDFVHYPGMRPEEANRNNKFETPLYYELCSQILAHESREEVYEDFLFHIRPVSDNRPFFNDYLKISKLGQTYAALGRKWLPYLQGQFLVLLVVIQAAIIAFLLILLPLTRLQKPTQYRRKHRIRVFFYFSLIGAAFMFVEITFIQKFILFLGHPLYATSIILFSLLVSSGLGSLSSKTILGKHWEPHIKAACIGAGLTVFLSLFLLPPLLKSSLSLPLPQRIMITFIVIFPVGFLMGFPFPSGIRSLHIHHKELIPWAWATNAFSSVICAALALLIAFSGGYNLVLGLAAGCYLLTVPLIPFYKKP